MNSVSWFIYIAQVSGSLGTMFMAFGIIGSTATGAYIIGYTVVDSDKHNEFRLRCPPTRVILLLMVFFILGNAMPDRNTMYAIAASQVGERIATSEIAKGVADDATKALQLWIKKQITQSDKNSDK